MSSQPSGETTCKHCGQPLPAEGEGAVCHACLMQEGLQSLGEEDGPDTALPTMTNSQDALERPTGKDPLEGSTLGPGGRYKILQRLGEGGFGVVYMAEQTDPVRRRVALKVLKAGMDTRQVVARFEAERQALAMMDHPNIAKVLDGGETEQGRPFFVMELVRGTPITKYCDREQLDPKARLALFTQVCRAVQHAHQKGIIHRDLKPSNILITAPDGAEPVPKVIDFGVAKAMESNLTDKTLFTRFEQMIGTPAYMSPEQAGTEAGIDVDTRADIYALGVLLYELLTGTTPFDSKTLQQAAFEEVRRILREEEAPRPSARLSSLEAERRTTIAKERDTEAAGLNKLLRGDLDWIVMKAIEKDRRRRYETANALALDIERHLADEPVSAGPPTAAYRTGKFLRRHKAPLAVAATVLLLLVAGITATSWQALRATKEKEHALEAEALAEEHQKEAEAISEFITGIFEAAKPGAEEGGRTITVEESLKSAEKKLEDDQEMPAARRAVLQESIAGVYRSLGRYENAVTLGEQVLVYYRGNLGKAHPTTLEAMRKLALSYEDVGRREEALAMLQNVLALRQKVSGPEDRYTLHAMHNLASSHHNSGRQAEALEMRENVLALRRKVLGDEHPDTLSSMNNLANSYHNSGRQAEALEMRENVLALRRKVNGDEHPDTLKAMSNLASSHHNSGRQAEALEMRENVLALRRKVLGSEHVGTLNAMEDLAGSYSDARRLAEALEMRESVLALRRKVLGDEHPHTLNAMENLANSYSASRRLAEALEMRESVLALRRKVNGDEHPDTLKAMSNLASSYSDASRPAEALEMREEALEISKKTHGPEHPDTLHCLRTLSNSYADAGRLQEALELGEEVLALSRKGLGSEHPFTLRTMGSLARISFFAGRRDEAQALVEEALPLHQKVFGPEHPDTLDAMYNLAGFYGEVGRDDEALAIREEVLALRLKAQGPEHPEILRAMWSLSNSYGRVGRREDELKTREEMLVLSRKILGPDHSQTLSAMGHVASSYAALGREDEALKLREEVLALARKVLGLQHVGTLNAMEDLADSYAGAGRRDEELVLREEELGLRRKVQGPENSDTLRTMDKVASCYAGASRHDEALKLFEEVLTRSRKVHGEAHPHTLGRMNNLGRKYLEVGRVDEALELIRHMPLKSDSPPVVHVLVPSNSEWRWHHPVDGIDPAKSDPDFHQTFFGADYDDSSWRAGTDSDGPHGGFGYGDEGFAGVDIGAPAQKGLSKAAYFRHRFTTTKTHGKLELRCQRDDGLIVYLDGKEVARENMMEGEESYDLPAEWQVGDCIETIVFRIPFEGVSLSPGEHVLAISLHNPEAPSSDLRIGEITLVEVAPKKAAVGE